MAITANDGEDQDVRMDPVKLKEKMTPEQKTFLRVECTKLLDETEDLMDATAYAGDVVSDMVDKWEDLEPYWELLRDVVNLELQALYVK